MQKNHKPRIFLGAYEAHGFQCAKERRAIRQDERRHLRVIRDGRMDPDELYLRKPSRYGYNDKRLISYTPIDRWLGAQVGRLWADVWRECVRTYSGEKNADHKIRDHVRRNVDEHELRRADGTSQTLSDYFIDQDGVLRAYINETSMHTGRKSVRRPSSWPKAKLMWRYTWINNELFWFKPTQIIPFHGTNNQILGVGYVLARKATADELAYQGVLAYWSYRFTTDPNSLTYAISLHAGLSKCGHLLPSILLEDEGFLLAA